MSSITRPALAFAAATCLLPGTRSPAAPISEGVIQRSVERGVAALKQSQGADGRFAGSLYGSGPTSLAALTMLECGVSPDDEHVRKAVEVVRNDCPNLNRVYNLSLAIMLFDRLGDPFDAPVLQTLAVRLLEGQVPEGGWSYTTPDVSSEEVQRLRTLILGRPELKTAPDGNRPPDRPALDPGLVDRLRRLERKGPSRQGVSIDNSNTQFAVLAVWVARRNGVPADFALRRAEACFRATHMNGIWPYMPNSQTDERVSNTCAGLLGLAIGTGVSREARLRTAPGGTGGKPPALRDPLKDPLVQRAMNFVGAQTAELAATGLNAEVNTNRNLYFLWSVERVGMVYSVQNMGGVDWYQLGAATILRAQRADGLWPVHNMAHLANAPEIGTCFALLFLRRSNFAFDLTANLRNKPAQTSLRSGGENPEPTPAAEPSEAERLVRELPSAPPERQNTILAELRDRKGPEYTDALAKVIPSLTGDVQKKARDALAERLARMTAATVREKLRDANAEIRRASALSCAMKEDKSFIPDLIVGLDDQDSWVVRATAVALRTLTGQDFGPSATATMAERAKAVAAWKAWWKRQNGR